jgi:hypothetical protein
MNTGTGMIKGSKVEDQEPGLMGTVRGQKLDTGVDTSTVTSELVGAAPTVTVIYPDDPGPHPAPAGSWPMSEERLEELKLQGAIKASTPTMLLANGKLAPIEQPRKSKGSTIW